MRRSGLLRAWTRTCEPVDISDLFAVEVDFQADLDRANAGLK
jgi:choline kinase